MRRLRVDIVRDIIRFGPGRFALYVATLHPNGEIDRMVSAAPDAEPLENNMQVLEPTLRLEPDDVQDLINQMWAQGVRPSAGSAEGELAATNRHLQDMRALVFKTDKP